jgi:Spy/CpxP family protein refolding chaperone
MKKLMTVLTVILFIAAIGSTALAQRGWGGRGPCGGGEFSKIPGLNLTAEQKAEINKLRDAHLKDIKPLKDSLYSKKGDLRLLWREKNPDQEKITAAMKEVRALRDQIQDKSMNHHWAVYKILTPEQRETLRNYGPMKHCFGPGMDTHQGCGMGDKQGMGKGMGHGADMGKDK